MIISNGELVLFPETQPQPLTNKRLTNLVSSGSSLLFLRLHWLVHFSLPRIYPDRMLKSSEIDIFILSQIVCSNNIKGGPLPFRLPK